MAWWRTLPAPKRAKWLKSAGSDAPTDAYAAFQRQDATRLTAAIRELASNPDSPASLRIMSEVSRAVAPFERARNQVVEAFEAQLANDGEHERTALCVAVGHWEAVCKGTLSNRDLEEMREEARDRQVRRRRMPPRMESILAARPSTTDTGYTLGVHLHGLEGTWHRLWAIISLAHSFGSNIQVDPGVTAVRDQFEGILGRALIPAEWDALVSHAVKHAESEVGSKGGSA